MGKDGFLTSGPFKRNVGWSIFYSMLLTSTYGTAPVPTTYRTSYFLVPVGTYKSTNTWTECKIDLLTSSLKIPILSPLSEVDVTCFYWYGTGTGNYLPTDTWYRTYKIKQMRKNVSKTKF